MSAIKIKGGKDGLWVILDKTAAFSEVESEIQDKLKNNVNYFPEGTNITVVAKGFGDKSKSRLQELFGERNITVNFAEAEPAKTIAKKSAEEQFRRQQQKTHKGFEAEPEAAKPQPQKEEMLVVHRTVRGGEEIVSEGSILICGNVHAGAQIIAGGNIDIRGTCSGVVHAGCYGDANAIIIADRMEPMQIRIANLIARSPDEMEEADKAEKAYIKDGRIVVEAVVR